MDWFFPLMMIFVGAFSIVFSRLLEKYLEKQHRLQEAQNGSVLQKHFDLYSIYGRMQSRIFISYALIGFGSFWILTNLF